MIHTKEIIFGSGLAIKSPSILLNLKSCSCIELTIVILKVIFTSQFYKLQFRRGLRIIISLRWPQIWGREPWTLCLHEIISHSRASSWFLSFCEAGGNSKSSRKFFFQLQTTGQEESCCPAWVCILCGSAPINETIPTRASPYTCTQFFSVPHH